MTLNFAAFHAMATALLSGAFFLAVIFLLVRLWARGNRDERRAQVGHYADYGLYLAVAVGWLFSLAAVVTGFLIWPLEAVLNSPIIKNKLTIVLMLVVIWGAFLYVRWQVGNRLWQNPLLTLFASLSVLVGFFFNLLANSIGGDAAGNASGFEQIVRIVGIETRMTFYIPTWTIVVLALLTAGCIAIGIAATRPSPQRTRT